ncbi:MAG: PASTA domain-containing protein, partial [Ruminiclostridium sp.]|nr:PASTA domain-containing protein [Ruminiclostridium sp.]
EDMSSFVPQTLPPLTEDSSSGVNSVPSNDTTYMVPNFVGRIFTSIQENQSYSFLKITAVYKFDDKVASGLVIKQNVQPDTVVKNGQEIEFVVSKGPGKVELPDYTGMSVDEYTALLSQKNIKFEKKSEVSKDVEPNTVIRCNKAVGDKIDVENSEKVTVYYAVKKNNG